MSDSNNDVSNAKRSTLVKLAAGGSTALIAGLTAESWVKPTLDAVMLPAHAQTSECMSGEPLILEVTSNDFSSLELELFSVGGGSDSLLQISPGDLSGSGTQILYDDCQSQDACYELVFRGGEGTASLAQGVMFESQIFPPTPRIITLGTTCS